jgi:hypothetical protein
MLTMRQFVIAIICFLKCTFGMAQMPNDTNYAKINIGVTSYSYAYNTSFESGSTALGLSLFLPDGRLTCQLGLLVDLKKYDSWDGFLAGNTLPGNTFIPDKRLNIFVPILLHYSYYVSRKVNCFITAGFIFGGSYYINENNKSVKGHEVNLLVGAGIAYSFTKKLNLRALPSIRENEILFPGLLLDFTADISYQKSKG